MMKRLTIIFLCLIIVVALIGCGPAEQFLTGRITSRTYEEAHTEVRTGVRPMVCGKVTVCMPYTYTLSCPETWEITFVDQNGRERNIGVQEGLWLNLSVGDSIKYDRWNGTIKILEGAG